MIPASVGFQCPECVRNEPVPQPKVTTPVGGARVEKPYVTYVLIAINVLLFAFSFTNGIDQVAQDYGMFPPAIAVNGEYWRLLSSAFLHGSMLHILFNMYVLFVIGQALERILGHVRYSILFIVAALGGAVASYAFSDVLTVSVGASGAIFGLMGALIVAGKRLRWDITQVLVLLGVNVVIGFLSPDVDWRAHFGGLVIGALVAAVFVWTPPPFRSVRGLWQTLGVLAILGALVAVTMWRTGQLWTMLAPLGVG